MVRSVLKQESGFTGGACTPLLTSSPLMRASSVSLKTTGLCQSSVTCMVALHERRESPYLSAQFNLLQSSQRSETPIT